ncbi:uncharacterized protein LOC130590509 [Beta vulgaris subsp. vulgaris]|uniref:uncharacterized protein LOC130590509 n=1 Tax=Beta vulgaris subsp. vulgaris TaxID=3555 RepID=UPI0025499C7E|nr:uncharacterized protein LOC130590509 [Beta vulgaris subsp. vulgaris]
MTQEKGAKGDSNLGSLCNLIDVIVTRVTEVHKGTASIVDAMKATFNANRFEATPVVSNILKVREVQSNDDKQGEVPMPNLSLNNWSVDSLSRIRSMLGVPLFADECTIHQKCISFARMLIEVDVTKPLPKTVLIEEESGKMIKQRICFEWDPSFCKKYQFVGHDCAKKGFVSKGGKWENLKQTQKWHKLAEKPEPVVESITDARKHPESDNAVVQSEREVAETRPPWNIVTRGQSGKEIEQLKGPGVIGEIKKFIGVNKVTCFALLETRVRVQNKEKIHKKFGNQWKWESNYDSSNKGRIWLAYDPSCIVLQLLQKSSQLIHCELKDKSIGTHIGLIAVYGMHTIEDRKALWPELLNINYQMSIPWCAMGDFNAILACGDRLNGNPVYNYETRDYMRLLATSDLGEYKSRGHFFSWSNKGVGPLRIASRFDRCLVNSCWLSMFPSLAVEYMNPGI